MPSSSSNVRGLTRDVRLDLEPDEPAERMMRRVDRREVEAVCRHLVGRVGSVVAAVAPAELAAAGSR
ncbi:hypothetical protein SAMN05443575_0172 [Jatrophihabitans endophyticus]|uniref:Uncharacterized protein n=1 Tax=Jatrophihabitans endophyticus TaxID=1206085 RepID=A0A1M5CAX8_9ACTN|nr:hypothetical protein [Jatrophihabitans endophyticus]SHF51826.1 hypothetical protein SAMN05443575_0172 [Jatrophihabitans endophyticus]